MIVRCCVQYGGCVNAVGDTPVVLLLLSLAIKCVVGRTLKY